jgi:hypothetical protein
LYNWKIQYLKFKKKSLDRLNSRMGIIDINISELKDKSIKLSKLQNVEEKIWVGENRAWETYDTM